MRIESVRKLKHRVPVRPGVFVYAWDKYHQEPVLDMKEEGLVMLSQVMNWYYELGMPLFSKEEIEMILKAVKDG